MFANCFMLQLLGAILLPTFHLSLGAPGELMPGGSGALAVDDGSVLSITADTGDRLLIAGYYSSINGAEQCSIARLHADGSLDSTLPMRSMAGHLHSALPLPGGKILIAGDFQAVGDVQRIDLARLNADGSVDQTFNAGASSQPGHVDAVAVDIDGTIIAAGDFTTFDSAPYSGIVRLSPDGRVDRNFDTGAGLVGHLPAVLIDGERRILVGGAFVASHGRTRYGITRLRQNGSSDSSFDVGLGVERAMGPGSVYAMALQPDGKILIGGNFTRMQGVPLNRIARLNPNGALDDAFAIGDGVGGPAGTTIFAIAVQADGKILVAGTFSAFNGQGRSNIARLNRDGTLDTSFVTPQSFDGSVNALFISPTGRIAIGGYFTSIAGSAAGRFAWLRGDARHANNATHRLDMARADMSASLVELGVSGAMNCSYTIEWSTNLHHWRTMTNMISGGVAMMVTNRIDPASGRRFYRLLTP